MPVPTSPVFPPHQPTLEFTPTYGSVLIGLLFSAVYVYTPDWLAIVLTFANENI